MKFKLALIVLIYLSAQSFFNPFDMIPSQVSKALYYGISMIGLITAYFSRAEYIDYPRKSYFLVISGIFISVISVWVNYGQPLMVSLMTTLPKIFSYLFLYILIKLSPDKDFLFKFIKIMVVCSFVIYLVNLATIPNVVFGQGKEEYDTSRGFFRVAVPMIEIVMFYLFYSISQFMDTGKKSWLLWIGITGFLVIFSLTRQVMFLGITLSLLMVFQKSSIFKKVIVVISVVLFSIFVLPEIPIYKSITEQTELQMEKNSEGDGDIRQQAWLFYTIEYQKNLMTRLFGNGMPSINNSLHGNNFEVIISRKYGGNGCYFVDVGWAGFYWLFGIFATLGLLSLFRAAAIRSRQIGKGYIIYWILFIVFTSIASAPILYHFQVVGLCLILYIVFGNEEEFYSVDNPQLQ